MLKLQNQIDLIDHFVCKLLKQAKPKCYKTLIQQVLKLLQLVGHRMVKNSQYPQYILSFILSSGM